MSTELIKAPYAIIGGSSTYSISFPDDLDDDRIRVIIRDEPYPTPFGDSPPLTLFEITAGRSTKRVVTCKMHGWMKDRTRAESSKQIFHAFKEMGVSSVIAEGGVGCINTKMKPGDIFIPDDYIDWSMRKDVSITNDYLLVMRDPVCHEIKKWLSEIVTKSDEHSLHLDGVYAVTEGRHFESRAEVRALETLGADVVGQSFVPEVYLAREIKACYAGLYLVVNFAEGVIPSWDYEKFKSLFYSESKKIGRILIETVISLDEDDKKCDCKRLSIETLLK